MGYQRINILRWVVNVREIKMMKAKEIFSVNPRYKFLFEN